MPIMLTIRQMRYFDALATTRHFGRAAELANVTQPALSTQIMEMENHLGVKLVERARGATLLTARGEEVLAQVRAILAQIDTLEQSAQQSQGLLDGKVRIGIIPTVAPYLVPHLVPYLRGTYPDVQIELREAVTDHLIADLGEGRLDAVVAALPIEAAFLRSRPLLTDRFFMAMAENDRDVILSPLTEAEVDPERLLLLEEGHCLRDQALGVCGVAEKRSLVNIGATSMTTLLQMVAYDMGMTLIPEMAIPTEAARNRLTIVPFRDPAPSRQIALFWRASDARLSGMGALAEAIMACAPRVDA
ncbi:LysR family hydrogen peroxide-inducible transcriptional activator [Rhizobium borbori]|uniref:HTH-type transcriptional regulator TtuA n=2 Tax=Allorhizobium borbori TaxID=485907 RepID=A0A7W6K2Z8_9HYPH|nr:LysR family hydrogen peroxide-inducible transcriptional activator [Allorhizobium borbori]